MASGSGLVGRATSAARVRIGRFDALLPPWNPSADGAGPNRALKPPPTSVLPYTLNVRPARSTSASATVSVTFCRGVARAPPRAAAPAPAPSRHAAQRAASQAATQPASSAPSGPAAIPT